jgi:hypothetical protein
MVIVVASDDMLVIIAPDDMGVVGAPDDVGAPGVHGPHDRVDAVDEAVTQDNVSVETLDVSNGNWA